MPTKIVHRTKAKKSFKNAWKKEKKKQAPKHKATKPKESGSVKAGERYTEHMLNMQHLPRQLAYEEQWRLADQSLTNWAEFTQPVQDPLYTTVPSVNERQRRYQMG